MIELSKNIEIVMMELTNRGFEVFVVGGFVRDALMGHRSFDIDLCTNALPEQLLKIYKKYSIESNGHDYGVKFMSGEEHFEISTMRLEGDYEDGRRPSRVEFINHLFDDSKRRDFTVNALYYHPRHGLIDYYDGVKDLQNHTLRVIGDPKVRFKEDVLRIARLYRFKSELGFDIDAETLYVVQTQIESLQRLKLVQIYPELSRYLLGPYFLETSLLCPEFLMTLFPPLKETLGFDQHNPFHEYSLYEHTIRTMQGIPNRVDLKLVALFHDLGKSNVQTVDDQGIAHYPGHAQASCIIARPFFEALQFSIKKIAYLEKLILEHDLKLQPVSAQLQQLIRVHGIEWVEDLMAVKRADNLAKGSRAQYQVQRCTHISQIIQEIRDQKRPTSIRDLEITASDLKKLGIEGKTINKYLNMCLDRVIEGTLPNTHESLLNCIKEVNEE
ncbi:HD domain-containing protein [Erysipelothrix rhusiopathiae]|uniref:CCA tRNA nucleotidyltransferase n=1 Tax=Erysipelothrix rhusiopathiae TaxID=1648 RepID=UPI0023B130F2|nr:HD domain-containing protein [Erysipelothrix rhusiopathiae]MDE8070517.1 HD domain-containing protein [Erysipelothrix rhusiopathiae]MDE8128464.1 HD domain-containing protein [Erysipelothrix rhusiopathiae]MDE8253846.1 HD domain-containing protein [Erysipelothrix rhusiopathiae]MDE8257237.1 HD domain-containing protein [Erysipelothrix rhusiopathiae]MDE8289404.1 HD domain-containing protein [Erysipelothrix rhusiopathiae]